MKQGRLNLDRAYFRDEEEEKEVIDLTLVGSEIQFIIFSLGGYIRALTYELDTVHKNKDTFEHYEEEVCNLEREIDDTRKMIAKLQIDSNFANYRYK